MRRRKEVKRWTPLILVLSLALLAGCGGGGGDGSMDRPGKPWAVQIQGVTAVGKDSDETGRGIATDTAGNVYVTGARVKFFIEGDGFVLKYLPDGTGP